MNITLMKNTSDKNVVSKTTSNITSYNTAEIKNPCSIIDPVIILPYYTDNTNTSLKANYMYITEFGRYYYITKIEVEHQRIIFYCHVDVLMSFSNDIKNMKGLIERQANDDKFTANLYLHDSEFRALAYKDVATEFFKNSSNKVVKLRKDLNMILTVAGGGQ